MYCNNSEIISAIVAVIAVLFAVFEAIFKFHGKNAERKTSFYAKYQYIYQQLDISTLSVGKFLTMAGDKEITIEELYGFAKAHMVPDDVFKCIYDYQELAFICLKGNSNEEVRLALEFGGLAKSCAESINALFQSVFQSESGISDSEDLIENIRSLRTKRIHEEMNRTLSKLKNIGDSSESVLCLSERKLSEIMHNAVKNQRRRGDLFRGIYIILCVFLLGLCSFYVIYLNLGLKLFGG